MRDGVSNDHSHHCLLSGLFRRRSKETSKLRITGLCARNSPVTGEFPAQMASNAENDFIWWRHHGFLSLQCNGIRSTWLLSVLLGSRKVFYFHLRSWSATNKANVCFLPFRSMCFFIQKQISECTEVEMTLYTKKTTLSRQMAQYWYTWYTYISYKLR